MQLIVPVPFFGTIGRFNSRFVIFPMQFVHDPPFTLNTSITKYAFNGRLSPVSVNHSHFCPALGSIIGVDLSRTVVASMHLTTTKPFLNSIIPYHSRSVMK